VVTYELDRPSRMCVLVRLMRRPAWWIYCVSLVAILNISRDYAYVFTCLSSSHTHVWYTYRLHFGPRVAHCPEATHVCIVRAPVPPPHTHVPAPPHTLTCPTSHLSCLMYSASAGSSLKRQAWGIRQALCSLPAPHPECIYLSHPMLACRRRPLDTGNASSSYVIGMSHYGPQCAHTDDTAAPSSSGHSISTRH
jgi:hypothetical protein